MTGRLSLAAIIAFMFQIVVAHAYAPEDSTTYQAYGATAQQHVRYHHYYKRHAVEKVSPPVAPKQELTVSDATARLRGLELIARMKRDLGTNPSGWQSLWCGRYLSMITGRNGKHSVNLASDWQFQGTPAPKFAVGSVGVSNGHVLVVAPGGDCPSGTFNSISGNSVGRVVSYMCANRASYYAFRWVSLANSKIASIPIPKPRPSFPPLPFPRPFYEEAIQTANNLPRDSQPVNYEFDLLMPKFDYGVQEVSYDFDTLPPPPKPRFVTPREQSILHDATQFLVRIARYLVRDEPSNTMRRQGVDVAIGRLNPDFRIKLAAAFKEARAAGIDTAGCQSAYRPPVFGVGGYVNKFDSLHAYGLACDVGGLDGPGGSDTKKFYRIALKHGLYNPYGPYNGVEFNHFQAVPANGLVYSASLRPTITANGPKSLERMWIAGYHYIKNIKFDFRMAKKEEADKPHPVIAEKPKAEPEVKVASIGKEVPLTGFRKIYQLVKEEAVKYDLDPKALMAFAYLENGNSWTGLERETSTSAMGVFGLTAPERARMRQKSNSLAEQVRAGVKHLADDFSGLKTALKRTPTPTEHYACHWLGLGAGIAVIKAPDHESLRVAIDRGQPGLAARAIAANPALAKMRTVADFRRALDIRMQEAKREVRV